MIAAGVKDAVRGAQLILRTIDPKLILDGHFGSYTGRVYDSADALTKALVDSFILTVTKQTTGNIRRLYAVEKQATTGKFDSGVDVTQQRLFREGVIPEVIKEARKRGWANPGLAAGVMFTEAGGGGKPTGKFNYAGIKSYVVKGVVKDPPYSMVATHEYINGVRTPVTAAFKDFDSVDAFISYWFDKMARKWPDSLKARSPEELVEAMRVGKDFNAYATAKPADYVKLVASGLAQVSNLGLA